MCYILTSKLVLGAYKASALTSYFISQPDGRNGENGLLKFKAAALYGEDRYVKWLWMQHGCWSECYTNWSSTQPSLVLTGNGLKKRKYPVMSEVKWRWLNWMELTERHQELKREKRSSFNWGIQKSISKHTTTTPSATDSYKQPTEATVHTDSPTLDNRRMEKKNTAWSDESPCLLPHSDGRLRIRWKQHGSMDPSCLVSVI